MSLLSTDEFHPDLVGIAPDFPRVRRDAWWHMAIPPSLYPWPCLAAGNPDGALYHRGSSWIGRSVWTSGPGMLGEPDCATLSQAVRRPDATPFVDSLPTEGPLCLERHPKWRPLPNNNVKSNQARVAETR